MHRAPVVLGLAWSLLIAPLLAEGRGLFETRHNLSVTGPGTVKAPGVTQVCIFCHTPHHASQTRALWNRDLPTVSYTLYTSSTLEAELRQPTGASRLCLSCHDGTLALGALRVRPATGPVALGPLTGPASLGIDLSDDHPVSLVYDEQLSTRRGELVDPTALPTTVPLDDTEQLQCTACHDPHEDLYRQFLRMDDRAGALCTACHRLRNWPGSSHATSGATWNGEGTNPWPRTPYTQVWENACESCHRPHAAPRGPRLLGSEREQDVCLVCHNGNVASADIEGELTKFSAHPVDATNWTHEPFEDPTRMARHVTCVDCHQPHQVVATPTEPPAVPGALRGVQGVSLSGSVVAEATQEYEVCFKCHGLTDQATSPAIVREDNIRNVRLEIDPGNPGYHPVAAAGRNTTMGGFEPGFSAASIIYCTACHTSGQASAGGPNGPHGSEWEPILASEYRTDFPTPESAQAYALCYTCHSRQRFVVEQTQGFPHAKHVREHETPCAVCHDAHGARENPHLVNFMLNDMTGTAVVQPSQEQGRIEYLSLGPGRGECFLFCHDKNHEPESYPRSTLGPLRRLSGSPRRARPR